MGAIIPVVFTAGWASGINPYLFTLLTILLGRFGFIDIPDVLERTDVLIAILALTAIDTVISKIIGLDSLWDAVNTIVRPLAGGTLSILLAAPDTTLTAAILAASGGILALATHLAKSTIRAAINTSPEPASNILASLIEDTLIALVVLLAALNPYLAAGIALISLLVMLTLALLLKRTVTTVYRRLRQKRHYEETPAREQQTSSEPRDASPETEAT